MYLGNANGMERTLVPQEGIQSYFFPMAPPTSLRGVLLLALATVRALCAVLKRRPGVTFATGGYVSVPATIASWIARVPVVLFLPDVVPGRAIAWTAPLAKTVAVSTDAPGTRLGGGKRVVTGYPLRPAFLEIDRTIGRELLGLPRDATVLCVFGASQGARSINRALAPLLPELLRRCHVVHISGQGRYEEATTAADELSHALRDRYHLYPYLSSREMAAALAAADLAVCRSGASVLGELPATGTPAVLVPFPDPAVHQRENAEYLVEHGAGVLLDDAELQQRLGPLLEELLDDPARLHRMATAAQTLAKPEAAANLARVVEEVAT